MIDVQIDGTGTIRLKGSADVHHAADLHANLVRILKEGVTGVALDLGGLTDLDAAGIQLLLAFKRSIPEVRVHSCPDKFRSLLERTGLVQLLL